MASRPASVRSNLFLVAAAILIAGLACNGGGSKSGSSTPTSPPAPVIRYLQVHGSWEGTWLAYGFLPVKITLHLGQDGATVNGTLWMNVSGTPFNFQITGAAAQNDGSGVGSFTWSASDSSGRIDCPMTLAGTTLSGSLTLSAGGEVISGPVSLSRTSTQPGALVSGASSEPLRELRRLLVDRRP